VTLTLLPETSQVPLGEAEKLTERFELAVALTWKVSPTILLVRALKVIV
jgi:hypothetical protein